MTANIEAANFGEKELKQQPTDWKVTDAYGKILAKGQLAAKDITIGNCQQLGTINLPLNTFDKAQKLNLEVSFACSDVSNNWDFWVYPQTLPEVNTSGIYITDKLDDQAQSTLNNGGKVLLLTAGKIEQGKDVVQYLTPAFWNTSWFKMRPPHTVGTLVNNYHPILEDFPTDTYTNVQWWELIYKAQTMEMNNFPASFQPIVQTIDTWFINRKLGMLFEAKVGNGKIVVCSADLRSDLQNRPVARQLYYSIVQYMNSHKFNPEQTLNISVIEDLFKKEGERLNINTKDAPDELKNKVL